jgi:nucleotide-binding universal stress UspA family protein
MSALTAQTPRKAPVVVAVDGSDTAMTAAQFAASEAEQRQLPLLIMHCFMWPTLYPPLTEAYPPDPQPREKAKAMLAAVAAEIRGKHPDLEISTRLRNGPPAAMLTDTSGHASMLVLGCRGAGGFAGLHIGSVAIHTAAHARCPVLVVRGTVAGPHAPILVGVDGSAESDIARRFAFETAKLRGAPLRVVAVWPPAWALPRRLEYAAHRPAEMILLDQLGDLPARYPELTIDTKVVHSDSAAGALLAEATDAGLVVVGSRGRGGLRGILLGSVGRALIAHSPCPVAVVRD